MFHLLIHKAQEHLMQRVNSSARLHRFNSNLHLFLVQWQTNGSVLPEVPQFPHLQGGNNTSNYLLGFLGMTWGIHVKGLESYPAHDKDAMSISHYLHFSHFSDPTSAPNTHFVSLIRAEQLVIPLTKSYSLLIYLLFFNMICQNRYFFWKVHLLLSSTDTSCSSKHVPRVTFSSSPEAFCSVHSAYSFIISTLFANLTHVYVILF